MSDKDNKTEVEATENVPAAPSELDVLKSRARMMGINFSNNIGVEALRAKINEKLQDDDNEGDQQPSDTDESQEASEQLNPLAGDTKGEKPAAKLTHRQQKIREATRLVRCRITNLDPKKKDLPGEIITIGNKFIGTIRKFVPFGEVTDDGYHIPHIIYEELESRRFLNIRTSRDRRTGQTKVDTNWAKEFAIEVLPQLTQEELNRLANAQAAAGSVGD